MFITDHFLYFLPSPPPCTSPNHTGWSLDPSSVSPATIVVTTGFTYNRREGVPHMAISSKVSPTRRRQRAIGLNILSRMLSSGDMSHVLCLLGTKKKHLTINKLKCVGKIFERISHLMGVEQGTVLYFLWQRSPRWATNPPHGGWVGFNFSVIFLREAIH